MTLGLPSADEATNQYNYGETKFGGDNVEAAADNESTDYVNSRREERLQVDEQEQLQP